MDRVLCRWLILVLLDCAEPVQDLGAEGGDVIVHVPPEAGEFIAEGREVLSHLGAAVGELTQHQGDADPGDVGTHPGGHLEHPDAQHQVEDLCL
ncbi:hypothetical protein [Nonomuraea solani]|uniref:hypothetical protein n=1 Tax=Nonomuraea solani TaxID=1144553 RepID=UPI0011AFE1FD|nr:hypothetical protein [Nonomuraea solani]